MVFESQIPNQPNPLFIFRERDLLDRRCPVQEGAWCEGRGGAGEGGERDEVKEDDGGTAEHGKAGCEEADCPEEDVSKAPS